MIVKKLKPEQFSRLKGIFENEFDSDPPLPENSDILVCYEGSKMIGFVLIEEVKLIGQIYVVKEEREKSFNIVKSLIESVKERIAPKSVVAAVASEKRFENLFRAFGMEKIEGKFYRKNINEK